MAFRTSARLIGGALAVGAATLALAGPPAGAATTTVQATGATITRTDATAGTTLTVKATVARLDLWCSSNKLVVNKKATTIPCNKLLSVTTTGLTGNDAVEINATSFGSSLAKTTLIVKTGAGNDTINVRHNGSLTVYAGAGNDKIGAGLASGSHPVSETLLGEDGNDTLTNYGFITAPRVEYNGDAASIARSKAVGSILRGGPGADTIVGDNTRWSDVAVASNDTVNLKEGPALVSPDEGAGVAPAWTYQVSAGSPWNTDTLTYGRATSLTVRCVTTSGFSAYTINGLRIPVPCAYHYLDVHGTDRAETFDFDQNLRNGPDRYGMGVHASMLGGDDVATIRSAAGSLTADGGAGNDRLTVGLHGFGGESGASGSLAGGPGNDTLTNLGFLDPNPPVYVPGSDISSFDYLFRLIGGPGTDRLNGASTTYDGFVLDTTDTADVITDPGGPAWAWFDGTAGDDNIFVRGNESAGTTIDIAPSYGTGTKRITLPKDVVYLMVDTGAGDDALNLEGRSKLTRVYGSAGDGIDGVTMRPYRPFTAEQSLDGENSVITQLGYQPMIFDRWSAEIFTISPIGDD